MTTIKKIVGRILLALAAFYGGALTLFLVLRAFISETWTPIAIINLALTYLLLPSLVLFPSCLILRRWRLAALLVAPCLGFIFAYAPFFLPRSINVPQDAPRLHLLTYNLHTERQVLNPMVDLIRKANADIVALQEMSPEAGIAIDSQLADVYPYRELFPALDGSWYHGRGLLSRYPITEVKSWPLEYPIPVRLMRAVVDMNGTPITIYNFHAPPSTPIYGQGIDLRPRAEQIQAVLDMIAQDHGAVLWMGDFNTVDTDPNYPLMTASLHDVYREVGWGLGLTNPDWSFPQSQEGPTFIPMYQRPDYIFHNDYFKPLEAKVWPTSGGSDHRPVFAELALVP